MFLMSRFSETWVRLRLFLLLSISSFALPPVLRLETASRTHVLFPFSSPLQLSAPGSVLEKQSGALEYLALFR